MYMELTPQDTIKDLQRLLVDAIPGFEFPRKDLYNYELKIEDELLLLKPFRVLYNAIGRFYYRNSLGRNS